MQLIHKAPPPELPLKLASLLSLETRGPGHTLRVNTLPYMLANDNGLGEREQTLLIASSLADS